MRKDQDHRLNLPPNKCCSYLPLLESESLVRWIANDEKIPILILGKKNHSGILESMITRKVKREAAKRKSIIGFS
jgi:hypothetical protein